MTEARFVEVSFGQQPAVTIEISQLAKKPGQKFDRMLERSSSINNTCQSGVNIIM